VKDDKIIVAWLWPRYEGLVCFGAPIILGLDPQRYQPICVYLMKSSEKPNSFEEKGYEVFYISRKKFFRMFNLWIIWKLSRVLKRENVDILHCHKHQATIYGTIAAKLAGVPVVFSHVHGLNRSKNPRRKFINWIVLKWATKIIAVANSVKEDVLKNNWALSSDKLSVLENSVDFECFANVAITKVEAKGRLGVIPPDAFVYGTIARFGLFKGHSFLISAFEKVKKQVASAHLILVGDGLLKEEIQKQVAKAGLDESVHFLGQRDNIAEIYKAIDVFVLPSIGSEGMPRVILEAMAAGVPCVATKVGGIPEIVSGEDVGFLVPPGDENALAEVMLKLAKMPEKKRQKLIGKAQDEIRRFYAHEVVREKLRNLYETELTH